MKNIYSKYNNSTQDDRPIPEPEDMLFNNPDENGKPPFTPKVKTFDKSQKSKNKLK